MQDVFCLLNYKRSTKQYPRRISAIKRRFFMKEFNVQNEHKYTLAVSLIGNMLDQKLINDDEYYQMIEVVKEEVFAKQNNSQMSSI